VVRDDLRGVIEAGGRDRTREAARALVPPQ
jgi:hypothetical protein